MEKYYFNLDVINKTINFFYTDIEDNAYRFLDEGNQLSVSFNQIPKLVEDYNTNIYNNELQDLTNNMIHSVSQGKEESKTIQENVNKLKAKYNQNILATIVLNILNTIYCSQRNMLSKLGIPKIVVDAITHKYIKLAEETISEKYQECVTALQDFQKFITEKNFSKIQPYIFETNTGYIFKTKNNKSMLYYNINESIIPFFHLFISNMYIGNLEPFICVNCHNIFFDTYNSKYCPSVECQKIKECETRKESRINRKRNVYTAYIDTFHTYVRQLRYKLKQRNTTEINLLKFKEKADECCYDIKMQVLYYQDINRPIDDELESYVLCKKHYLKKLSDNIPL